MLYQRFGVNLIRIAVTVLVVFGYSRVLAADVVRIRCDYTNSMDVIDGQLRTRRAHEEGYIIYEFQDTRILATDDSGVVDTKAKDVAISQDAISFTAMNSLPFEADQINISLRTHMFSEKIREPPNWDTRIIVYGTCGVVSQ